ncbi:MAG: Putative lipoprotein thiredoxin [uncultured Sulfurovum sp.]|uniref:Lipoprotein thiredoxin n=1 Tax=uncultured Sulfurovum sp. TaxID=269237 RepID=A0A6S6TXE0_9BACT|nr:MAG: Putative lipoprotein thiredoxin [uncultured Sulfurovum sp.]
MKNKFYLILVTLIFTLSGCEEKSNSTETAIKNDTSLESKQEKNTIIKTSETRKTPIIEYNYEFKNLKNQVSTLNIKNDIYDFKNIKQPIVIITVMSTWCPPCRGQIPHLSKLQQKFKDNLFVMATLVHDDIEEEQLNKFIIAQKMLFYVSVTRDENLKFINMLTPKLSLSKDFPMPLTIVFVKGTYFTHYEGMIPEEMIESDIKQLLQKINN